MGNTKKDRYKYLEVVIKKREKKLIVNVVGGDEFLMVCKKEEVRKESNWDVDKEM